MELLDSILNAIASQAVGHKSHKPLLKSNSLVSLGSLKCHRSFGSSGSLGS